MYQVTCPVFCPVPSSFALALLATTAVAQLVTSLQPTTRGLQSVFFFLLLACNFWTVSGSQLLDCFRLATSTTLRHSHSRAAKTFRGRKRTAAPTRRFTRTIRTQQCKRQLSLLDPKAKTKLHNRPKGNQAVQAEAQHTRENAQPRQDCSWFPSAAAVPGPFGSPIALARRLGFCRPAQTLD